jgi:hypothetical protein
MTIKELKELIVDLPDNMQVMWSDGWWVDHMETERLTVQDVTYEEGCRLADGEWESQEVTRKVLLFNSEG